MFLARTFKEKYFAHACNCHSILKYMTYTHLIWYETPGITWLSDRRRGWPDWLTLLMSGNVTWSGICSSNYIYFLWEWVQLHLLVRNWRDWKIPKTKHVVIIIDLLCINIFCKLSACDHFIDKIGLSVWNELIHISEEIPMLFEIWCELSQAIIT